MSKQHLGKALETNVKTAQACSKRILSWPNRTETRRKSSENFKSSRVYININWNSTSDQRSCVGTWFFRLELGAMFASARRVTAAAGSAGAADALRVMKQMCATIPLSPGHQVVVTVSPSAWFSACCRASPSRFLLWIDYNDKTDVYDCCCRRLISKSLFLTPKVWGVLTVNYFQWEHRISLGQLSQFWTIVRSWSFEKEHVASSDTSLVSSSMSRWSFLQVTCSVSDKSHTFFSFKRGKKVWERTFNYWC